MSRLSGMEISLSPGLKTPHKLAYGQKFLLPKVCRHAGERIFTQGLIFEGVFNPRDEEIFIPDNHGPFGHCIPVRVNQTIFFSLCYHLTNFLMRAHFFFFEILQKQLKNSSNHNKFI
jgi:hypothetical protein